jgi:hypothetical protein
MQELIALQFEEFYPPSQYTIYSFDCYGADIEIKNKDTQEILTGEVKSCTEYWFETYYKHWRRGQFKMCINQLDVDFYAFAIRFCGPKEEGYVENGEHEAYFVETKYVREYFSKLTINNCKEEFVLGIAKLHTHLNAIQNLEEFIKKLPKI